jgi:ABC-type uncharacterized transport system substrate-binding protein
MLTRMSVLHVTRLTKNLRSTRSNKTIIAIAVQHHFTDVLDNNINVSHIPRPIKYSMTRDINCLIKRYTKSALYNFFNKNGPKQYKRHNQTR